MCHNQVLQAALVEGWQVRKPVMGARERSQQVQTIGLIGHQDLRGLVPACHTNSSVAEHGFDNLTGALVNGPHATSGRQEAKTFCNVTLTSTGYNATGGD